MVRQLQHVHAAQRSPQNVLVASVVVDVAGKEGPLAATRDEDAPAVVVCVPVGSRSELVILPVHNLNLSRTKGEHRACRAIRFGIDRCVVSQLRDEWRSHLFSSFAHVVKHVEIVPKEGRVVYVLILVVRRIDTFRTEGSDDLVGRANVVAVRVCPDIKLKVVWGHAQVGKVRDGLILVALSYRRLWAIRITDIIPAGIVVVLPRVHHTESPIALEDDGVLVTRKREHVYSQRALVRESRTGRHHDNEKEGRQKRGGPSYQCFIANLHLWHASLRTERCVN